MPSSRESPLPRDCTTSLVAPALQADSLLLATEEAINMVWGDAYGG